MKKPFYRRKLFLFSIVPLALILVYFLFIRDSGGQIDVLVFSKTEGFRHDSIEPGIEAIKKMGQEKGFSVAATEDAGLFREAILKAYNVIIFLNTTQDVLNEAQQIELNRFIQAGGGFVGVHAAADTEYDWPWYGELVGGWFQSHPNDPNVREGVIHLVDSTHASAEGIPSEWTKIDEWYDYKSMNPDVKVVLNVDENTYKRAEENPVAEPRPIAWYHEFDGGRAFYTGLGHTKESYVDPLFLAHLWGGIQYAAGEGRRVNYNNATVAPESNRYVKQVLVDDLNEPMELDLLGEGQVIFVERGGAVKLVDEAAGTTETIHTFDTFSDLEEGLLGVAVDPDYANNSWVYFTYSAPVEPEIRVSRFVLEDDALNLSSEKILLTIPVQRDECCHVAGSTEFGPDGNLFVSIGDNTSPRDTGYGPIDEREGREPWDAQKSSSNPADLRGSILRIKPEPDGTYSIPDGNLFPKDGSGGRPEIYVMGNRNPFRISIDQRTGFLYWGEVGPDAGQDSTTRGSKGYDEVNQARQAGFFGWPYFIGDNQPYHDHDFETDISGAAFNPEAPVNESPNNTGARELPPAQPAFIWYPYGPSELFPLVGDGSRNAMAGPVYYYDDYPESQTKFPDYYDGKLFIYDWMRGWIMAVTMDENGDYVRMERFLPDMAFSNTMDMLFAPDGSLYVLEYGPLWFSASPEAKLSHITYNQGNRAPVARIAADKRMGAAPMTVAFSSESVDYDRDAMTYAWDFGDASSTEANPTHTFETTGTHTIQLTVTDPDGESSVSSFEVLVGNDAPEIAFNVLKGNRTFYWDDAAIEYAIQASDGEDGSLTEGGIRPEQVTLTIDYLERGGDLALPALGHQAMLDASRSLIGKTLIEGSDCAACHQQEVTSVGPAYKDIAQRYQGDTAAPATLAKKIVEGGSGNWGEVPMAAHPQISLDAAQKMAEFILSAEGKGPAVKSAPLDGTYIFEKHKGKGDEGTYIVTATYTDRGGEGVGPLTAREVVSLRNSRLPAWQFDEVDGAQRFIVPEEAPGGMGGLDILMGTHGGVATYKDIDLTDVGKIIGTFAVAPTFTTGGTVDVFLGSPDGDLLGTFDVAQGLTDFGLVESEIAFAPVEGLHDLVFVYRSVDEDGVVCVSVAFEFVHKGRMAS